MRYEYYSNLALVSSAVVYMLAMFAHAAEWAAARRLTVTGPAERELVNVAASTSRSCALSPSTSSGRRLSKGAISQARPLGHKTRPPLAAASSSSAGWV